MLSPADLSLYLKAQQGLALAQDRLAFVGQHLGETYKIGERDTVNIQTGEITRGEVEAD